VSGVISDELNVLPPRETNDSVIVATHGNAMGTAPKIKG